MNIEQQFEHILKKKKSTDLLNFLKSISEKERMMLAPVVKNLSKQLSEFMSSGSGYKMRGTDDQWKALGYAYLLCLREPSKTNMWFIKKEHYDDVLDWYVPSWLNKYMNGRDFITGFNWWFTYDYMMEMAAKGYIVPGPELIARTLQRYVYDFDNQRQNRFLPERLLQYEETLKDHVWTLFQYETNISSFYPLVYIDGKEHQDIGWNTVFAQFEKEGKIERRRLLHESLLASNRNFNKTHSAWFVDLFNQLNPAREEFISLQADIFTLFSSPHSKVVNNALHCCKQIADDAAFDANGFLDSASTLVTSTIKSIVTACMQLMETIGKIHKDKQRKVAALVTPVFIKKDESLQTKAAKLIKKFGDLEDEELKALVSSYSSSMLSSVREILTDYLKDASQNKTPEIAEHSVMKVKTEDEPLPHVRTFDDLIFLCSQAFDNNETWHIDQLPAALLQWGNDLEGPNISKLGPAVQRAVKTFMGGWRSGVGRLDYLLACFFIDYALLLVLRNPLDASGIFGIIDKELSEHRSVAAELKQYGAKLTFLKGFKPGPNENLYKPYLKLLQHALHKLEARRYEQLLSTPTHKPAWIDPETFVRRLIMYQESSGVPGKIDLEIAISRCRLHNTAAALVLAKGILSGEMRDLAVFLMDPHAEPSVSKQREWMWRVAVLSKCPHRYSEYFPDDKASIYTGQYAWRAAAEDYVYDQPRWSLGKQWTEKITVKQKKIFFEIAPQKNESQPSVLKRLFKNITNISKSSPVVPQDIFYDDLKLVSNQFTSLDANDVRRLILLTPNNPQPMMAWVIMRCFGYYASLAEGDKRMLAEALKTSLSIWKHYGETGHLLVALSMLAPDKTVASYAAEIWINGVKQDAIDSGLVGEIIAKIEVVEYAPIKRFTDVIIDNMINVSAAHNNKLETLLTSLIVNLPETPIKNLRKLLEIYFELLSINKSIISDEQLRTRLLSWKENNGLKKVIKVG